MDRLCGTEERRCSLCCKVMGVVELNKPAGVWCEHADPGKGCRIYEDRPPTCRNFVCLWLRDPRFPEEARPDQSRVVLTCTPEGETILAHPDAGYPHAAENGIVGKILADAEHNGVPVTIRR
jgi:hypothetical protein